MPSFLPVAQEYGSGLGAGVALPKQLPPLTGLRTFLQLAYERLEDVVPVNHRDVCAGESHRDLIRRSLGSPDGQYLGKPMGRDTIKAVGFWAILLHPNDPAAIKAVHRPAAETFGKELL
jgi:mannose-1-phosphate guanylyltransferase